MIDVSSFVSVGSMIRCPCPTGNGRMRRAMVATVSSDTASCILEDITPIYNSRRYWIVAPLMRIVQKHNDDTEGEDEHDIAISDLKPLLPLEKEILLHHKRHSTKEEEEDSPFSAGQYKECGDALLRLRDYKAAMEMYEAGIDQTCQNLEIGGTILLQRNGHAVLADIDCMDSEKDKVYLDVTFHNSGEEETMPETQVLLVLLPNDIMEHLQERILLNMARCLLPLANCDTRMGHPEAYRKAAILACTLAITCAGFYKKDDETDSETMEEKARMLRAMAYMEDPKYYKHAILDLKKVMQRNNQSHSQAEKLLRQLQTKQTQRKKLDRKLAKDVCQWIETTQTLSNMT